MDGQMQEQEATVPVANSGGEATVRCEKCGSGDVNTSWHGEGGEHKTRWRAPCTRYGDDWGKPEAEHLHYACRNCQFSWTGGLTPTSTITDCEAVGPPSDLEAARIFKLGEDLLLAEVGLVPGRER